MNSYVMGFHQLAAFSWLWPRFQNETSCLNFDGGLSSQSVHPSRHQSILKTISQSVNQSINQSIIQPKISIDMSMQMDVCVCVCVYLFGEVRVKFALLVLIH